MNMMVTETLVLARQRKVDADMRVYLSRGGVIRPYDPSMRRPVRFGRSPRRLEDMILEEMLEDGDA